MIAISLDRQIDIQVATLILAIVGVSVVLFTSGILIAMLHRQRRELAANRRISTAMIDLSVQLEHEERRSRHAIKNLAYTLGALLQYWKELPIKTDFNPIIATLEEPPTSSSERLIHDLVNAREQAGVKEEGLAD